MSEKPQTSTPITAQPQDVDTSFRLFDFNIFDEKREKFDRINELLDKVEHELKDDKESPEESITE